jgi:putative spermidine/putrescine transport system ATP-binding protein
VAEHGVGLTLTGLTKTYRSSVALDGIDLTVAPGEFMTLLGPSGSGKTTTLNLVAGFIEPDSGDIIMGGAPLVGMPPHKRDIGVVFQNYALFPHMKVDANVAFPLKQRGVGKADIAKRVTDMLAIVGLEGYGGRYPRELSGGQQQRVALARALVFDPKLLLLDEPLGALDKRLRESLQIEIKRIHRELGVTFVFVTHDQEEALAMSDRIAVFNQGRIEQVGPVASLYENPQTLFVAKFLGDSNVVEGALSEEDGVRYLVDGTRRFVAPSTGTPGPSAAMVIRPERVRLIDPAASTVGAAENCLSGRVSEVIYLGSHRRVVVDIGQRTFLVDDAAAGPAPVAGSNVLLAWHPDDARLVPADAGAEPQARMSS